MLRPNQTKYKKAHKGRISPKFDCRANTLKFGSFGIQAIEAGKITANEIEAVRRTISGLTKRKSKLWIRIFPDLPITTKPTEVRMGKGKGNVAYWVAPVKPGKILFEISGKDLMFLKACIMFSKTKLSLRTQIVSKIFKNGLNLL